MSLSGITWVTWKIYISALPCKWILLVQNYFIESNATDYTVKLIVADSSGCADTNISWPVLVSSPKPKLPRSAECLDTPMVMRLQRLSPRHPFECIHKTTDLT